MDSPKFFMSRDRHNVLFPEVAQTGETKITNLCRLHFFLSETVNKLTLTPQLFHNSNHQAILFVIIPQMKHASSRAAATVATFGCFPFISKCVILLLSL